MALRLAHEGPAPGDTAPKGRRRPGAFGLFKSAAKDWSADDAATHAAALSFYTLFSISPLFVVAIAVAGLLYGHDAASERAMESLRGAMGEQAAAGVETILSNTGSKGAGILATVIGLVGVLLGASGVFGHLQGALNRMWRVKPAEGRGFKGLVRDRLLSFAMVVFMGLLLLASLAATTVLAAAGETLSRHLPFSSVALQAINYVLSLALTTLLFAILFRFLPDGRVGNRDLWAGALVTAMLFSVGRLFIGMYLARGSVSSPYGAAGSMVLLMLWTYYSSQVLFFGAEFTRALAERYGDGVRPKRGAERHGQEAALGAAPKPA